MRYFPVLLSVLALVACTSAPSTSGTESSEASVSSSSEGPAFSLVYQSAYGYSIGYPDTWSITEDQTLHLMNGDSTGTLFTPPQSIGQGTVFDEGHIQVAVTQQACPVAGDSVTLGGWPTKTNCPA